MRIFGKRQQQTEGLQKIPFHPQQAGGQTGPTDSYQVGYDAGLLMGKTEGKKEGVKEAMQLGIRQGIEQERGRMLQVFEQYAAVGHLIEVNNSNLLLHELINSDLSPELAGKKIVSLLSNQQAGTMVQSTVSATSDGSINPLIQNAQQRRRGTP